MTSTKPSWNPGRFLQTLTFFEVIPALSWFQRLVQGSTMTPPTLTTMPSAANTILVVGAEGGVGKRVVKQLNERGYNVHILAQPLERAADSKNTAISVPEPLPPALLKDIRAVIYAVDGSIALPADSISETIDNPDIQTLLQAIAEPLKALQTSGKTLFDFSTGGQADASAIADLWGALDDVVMGGVSASTIRQTNGAALFAGNVSTANSGGFASVRSRNLEPALDLSGYAGIKLRVKGDGQRYKFLMRSDDKWDSIAYSHSFDTKADEWIDVIIPFNTLIPVFRAKTLPNAAPLNASRVCSLQLMLSKFEYDGSLNPHFTPGSFALQIHSISAYGSPTLPQFVLVNPAAILDRPDAIDHARRYEDLVRTSGIPYTIIRPCTLTDTPGGKQLTVAQHDRLEGTISHDDVAALSVHAIAHPQACNATFAVKAEATDRSINWTTLFSNLTPDS